MSENDGKIVILRENQLQALSALIGGLSHEKAAAIAGVTPRTLGRWLHQSDFKKALGMITANNIGLSSARLAQLSGKAISVIDSAMTSKESNQSQKLRAANFTLSHLLKLGEYNEVLQRIDALESRLNSLDSPLTSANVIEG